MGFFLIFFLILINSFPPLHLRRYSSCGFIAARVVKCQKGSIEWILEELDVNKMFWRSITKENSPSPHKASRLQASRILSEEASGVRGTE